MIRNITTGTVLFDGEVLRPETPPALELNTRYVAVIQLETEEAPVSSAWDVLERAAGTVEAPPDWSSKQDHYLLGKQ